MSAASRFAEIDRLKSRLDSLRPLPEHTARTLHEQQVLEWTYHSNSIEGNTLTLMERKVLRFWNHEMLDNVDAVLEAIRGALAVGSPYPGLLPKGEGAKHQGFSK